MEKAKGDRPMELVRQTEKTSPLAAARLHRQLTVDEAARRAGLTPDEVDWLEDGRVYRFPSSDAALVATLLYASALGIDHREARILAGLAVAPRPLETVARGRRLAALAAAAAAVAALVAVLIVVPGSGRKTAAPAVARSLLPPAWNVDVDVLNGCGDINYTRQVASRIQALAYRIRRVTRASHFGQAHTVIYFEPGGEGVASRLAQQLGVDTAPLPGGSNPNRLVAIVGCSNVAGK
ncbi:MAG TPA: LytR C-terminal domain-containing protein [Gaiellaceae bacterium]